MQRGRVLVVDDDPVLCKVLEDELGALGWQVIATRDASATLELVEREKPEVALVDLHMPVDGAEVCSRVTFAHPDLPVLVMTALTTVDSAVRAIRAGAHDFVLKPVQAEALSLRLERALETRLLRTEVRKLRGIVPPSAIDGVVGASAAMRRLVETLHRVAAAPAAVLITGESGTGKELVARALHLAGKGESEPFVAVNCAAIPEALLESELFGHEKGAFTDARIARQGLFVQAGAGTLFLDEIGEMPPGMQVKLLRALQERKVRPVGASVELPVRARIVTATNRDLREAVAAGSFREDLFYRLDVVHLDVPPLRERGGDVLLLAQHFLAGFAREANRGVRGISPEAARLLLEYPWPGNVRELRNCIERAVTLTHTDLIVPADLPAAITGHAQAAAAPFPELQQSIVPLEELKRRYILRALEVLDGNKSLAARLLGIERKTLYRWLDEWKE